MAVAREVTSASETVMLPMSYYYGQRVALSRGTSLRSRRGHVTRLRLAPWVTPALPARPKASRGSPLSAPPQLIIHPAEYRVPRHRQAVVAELVCRGCHCCRCGGGGWRRCRTAARSGGYRSPHQRRGRQLGTPLQDRARRIAAGPLRGVGGDQSDDR